MTRPRFLQACRHCVASAAVASLGVAAAQQPQTTVRSVLNGVTMQPAPATVARGGIIAVTGTDLAPSLAAAAGTPLPLALGDPAVEVLVNGIPAPLYLVSPDQINAQVPWETETGWAEVVVRHGGTDTRGMPLIVADANPNLFMHEGTSSLIAQSPDDPATGGADPLSIGGPGAPRSAVGTTLSPDTVFAPGQAVTVFAAGLGETSPPLATGAVGGNSVPVASQRAFVGGLPAQVTLAGASQDLAGIYEMQITVPELAQDGEILRWYSGDSGGGAVLGSTGEPTYHFMPVLAESGPVQRVDLSDLNPYFVVATGSLNDDSFCYGSVQLLDFRRQESRMLAPCLLPSDPHTQNPALYRPFETALHSPVLAALTEPPGAIASGVTNGVLLIDTAAGTDTLVTLAAGVDRLQPGTAGSSALRLERPDAPGAYDLLDPAGEPAGQLDGNAPLPPLPDDNAGGPRAAQQVALGEGYRMRFPRGDQAVALLYDQQAREVASIPFPEGWIPLEPPRRVMFDGTPAGNSLGPATNGFQGDRTAYVIARATDGTADAVVAFQPELPEDPTAPQPETVAVKTEVTPFPAGSFAASCTDQVRWQRMPLTRTLAVVGSGMAASEWAGPQAGSLCLGDRLVLFDTASKAIESVESPAKLRAAEKGSLQSYLYFGDGEGAEPLAAAEAVHVFDGVAMEFKTVALPAGVGISLAQWPQDLPATAREQDSNYNKNNNSTITKQPNRKTETAQQQQQ